MSLETGLNRRCVAVTAVVRLWNVVTLPPAEEAWKVCPESTSIKFNPFIENWSVKFVDSVAPGFPCTSTPHIS